MTVKGLLYGHPKQLLIQALAALTIIVWDALITFVLLKIISVLVRGLRIPDEELESGDVLVHEEEAYPIEDGYTRVGELVGAGVGAGPTGGEMPVGSERSNSSPNLAGDAR